MSYIRGACGLPRWDGDGYVNVYDNFGMGTTKKTGLVIW